MNLWQKETDMKNAWMVAKRYFWKCAKVTKTERVIHLICDLIVYVVRVFTHKKRLLCRKADSLEHYCAIKDEIMVEIEAKKKRLVYEAPFFEVSEEKKHEFESPSIYVAILHGVDVLSSSGLILTKKDVLYDPMKSDKEHRIKWPWMYLWGIRYKHMFLLVNRDVLEVDQAINLCGFGANNYYHFTVEILSRLAYTSQLPDASKLPILIDEGIKAYPQLEQLLNAVKFDHEIIYVPCEMRVKTHLLIQPSMNTWMPMNVESWKLFRISDNLIARSGITNIRSCLYRIMETQGERKIYISRKNCDSSRLVNEAEMIPLFKEAGFEIVYPEYLSFEEQVRMFSSAKCIVGVTGAALTNILYCRQGTILGCIIPQEYEFCIYSSIAYAVGCQTLFLSPDIVFCSKDIAADRYRVDIGQCKRYVQELNKMCLQKRIR